MGQRLLVLIGLLSMFVAVLLSIFLILTCLRRWRLPGFFLDRLSPASTSSRIHSQKADDLETSLFCDDADHVRGQNDNSARSIPSDELSFHSSRSVSSPARQGIVGKTTINSPDLCLKQDCSLVLEIAPDALETAQVGQTLKYTGVPIRLRDEIKHARGRTVDYDVVSQYGRCQANEDIAYKRCCLSLQVISGPAVGLHCSRDSSINSRLQVTLGRVPPNDLLVRDSEVSGKHAVINWNTNRFRWELVDMGSLNGTFLNSQAINHPDSASRQWSDPIDLANGDIITLGTTSKILVKLASSSTVRPVPFGVGMASEPMSMRRGGKKLPMEDVSYCQWPLPGVEQFGIFGIFDGHGGVGAAKAASKILPTILINILLNPENRERILSLCDASKALREAFLETEVAMGHQYEGCTATILLVWSFDNQLFAQCANVGDSACVMNIGGQLISMTEDHRVTSLSEQARLREAGRVLKDGESRLCGMNLVRMLGDKFLKEQDSCFSAEPFVSQVVHIDRRDVAFALIASDGLWDVMSAKNVVQLILKAKERESGRDSNADWIANLVLNEAKTLRTKDNTSVVFLDFEYKRIKYSYTSV